LPSQVEIAMRHRDDFALLTRQAAHQRATDHATMASHNNAFTAITAGLVGASLTLRPARLDAIGKEAFDTTLQAILDGFGYSSASRRGNSASSARRHQHLAG
jgi:hypothetical protein